MLALAHTWVAKLTTAAVLAQLLIGVTASPFDAVLAIRSGTVAPNQECSSNSDCRSGNCIEWQDIYTACQRLTPSGDYAYNCNSGEYYFQDYCSGVAVGQACANQGECVGRCSKGKCVKTVSGKTKCKTDLGCSGLQVCRNSTCFLPAPKSLEPRESCKGDTSCRSGRCVTDLAERFIGEGIYPVQPSCDVFQKGQQGCRNFYDCYDAACLNATTTSYGTCQLAPDGERCVANFQCQNVCRADGICYTPAPGSVRKRDTCTESSQCLSGACNDNDFIYHYRPDFTKSDNSTFEWVSDLNCAGSPIGGKCITNDDCDAGTCKSGVCKGKPLGASCASKTECTSMSCTIPSGSKNGKCTKGSA